MTRENKCCDKCEGYLHHKNRLCTCHSEPEVRGEEWEKKLFDFIAQYLSLENYIDLKKFVNETRTEAYIQGRLDESEVFGHNKRYLAGLTEALTLVTDRRNTLYMKGVAMFKQRYAVDLALKELEDEIKSKITSIREEV